jgi:hypothetical protein
VSKKERKRQEKEKEERGKKERALQFTYNSASHPPPLSACLDGIPSLKPIKS